MSDVAPATEAPAPTQAPVPASTSALVAVPAQRDGSQPVSSPAAGAQSVTESAAERVGEVLDRAAAASGRVAANVVDRLRNDASLAAERGATTIADEVVEKIVGIAARGVPGVHDLGGDVARVFAGIRERIGLGDAVDDADRGVKVRLEGAKAAIEVTLVIEYGEVVRTVTDKVRQEVIGAVERMLNLEITEVNIRVDDVHVPETSTL